ncbi:conserved hypothetical protein [Arthrobacter sp. Hiyo8]|nr:conserved hypothetical protein [Arthrobacter sp. Hiyo8]
MVTGIPTSALTHLRHPLAIHVLAITAMGLPLLDNLDLEDLGTACAEEDRYRFMFVVAPLNIPRGTGSPINPLAVF